MQQVTNVPVDLYLYMNIRSQETKWRPPVSVQMQNHFHVSPIQDILWEIVHFVYTQIAKMVTKSLNLTLDGITLYVNSPFLN